jgi:glycosyltransferase involved in cell wall biosynthesis
MSAQSGLRVLLVDPSLFTAPYDAALTRGLLEAGADPSWVVRPTRESDQNELPAERSEPFFYRWVEQQSWLPGKLRVLAKGCAHALGLARLVARVARARPDIVHFQWVVVPPLDSAAMWLVSLLCPLVLTVHDTVPFNGDRMSRLQRWGFELPLRLSDQLIVHTEGGKQRLLGFDLSEHKVNVIPHGALRLQAKPSPEACMERADDRYRFVLFGELKHYKGIDVLVEALGLMSAEERARLHVVVAGRPRMDLDRNLARVKELGLEGTLELWPRRLAESEMADLFERADCFLFPYRQIDASGVYFLVKSLGKWLIASRVGIFAEDLREGEQGELLPVGDARALADAMTSAVLARRPAKPIAAGSDWTEIGKATLELYSTALARRAATRARRTARQRAAA